MENIELSNLDPKQWEFLTTEDKEREKIVRPSMTYWQDAWRRLRKNKAAMASLLVLVLIGLGSIFIPMFWKFSVSAQDYSRVNLPPNAINLFGTDKLGRDLFVRTFYGARISLIVGISASLISFVVGITYGGISGYVGGRTDNLMMRFVDILYSIPLTLVVILLMLWLPRGIQTILIAIGLTYWIGMARLVRGQIFALKEQEYVLAARTIGAQSGRILFRHLIPNAMGPIIVQLTMSIPSAIFTEAFLSFMGLGISPPLASLGSLANDSLVSYTLYPHLLMVPAAFLSIMMLAFNYLGDGLRDALDPKMRR